MLTWQRTWNGLYNNLSQHYSALCCFLSVLLYLCHKLVIKIKNKRLNCKMKSDMIVSIWQASPAKLTDRIALFFLLVLFFIRHYLCWRWGVNFMKKIQRPCLLTWLKMLHCWIVRNDTRKRYDSVVFVARRCA